MGTQPKKFWVKVDPKNPQPAVDAMYAFIMAQIAASDAKKAKAELAQPTRKTGRRKN